MTFSWHRQDLFFKTPWTTAHGSATRKQTLVVALTLDGVTGYGEIVPVSYHGQSLESAENTLATLRKDRFELSLRELIAPFFTEPARIKTATFDIVHPALGGQEATLAGLDAACYDLVGKRAGRSVGQLLGLRAGTGGAPVQQMGETGGAPVLQTDFSLGIDTPENTRRKAEEAVAAGFTMLKIKLGVGRAEDDAALLKGVRGIAPHLILRVDANEGWNSVEEACARIKRLAEFNLELVEQPLPRRRFDDHRHLLDRLRQPPIPIPHPPLLILDEDCAVPADLAHCIGCSDGVNIKLSKCGGISAARGMIAKARAAGLKIMLGCMAESSLGIAAAAQLGPLADFLDLDGHLLWAEGTDPWEGLILSSGRAEQLSTDAHPGLGVIPRSVAAPS